jgi:hypothetical protein
LKISKQRLQKIIKEEIDRLLVKEDNHTPVSRGEIGGRGAQERSAQGKRPGVQGVDFPQKGSVVPDRVRALGEVKSYFSWREQTVPVLGTVAHAFITLERTGEKPGFWPSNSDIITLSGLSEHYREGYESDEILPRLEQIIRMAGEQNTETQLLIQSFGKLIGEIDWPNDRNQTASGNIRLEHPQPNEWLQASISNEDDIQRRLFVSHAKYKNNVEYYPDPENESLIPVPQFGITGNSNSYAFSVVRDALGYNPVDSDKFIGKNVQVI